MARTHPLIPLCLQCKFKARFHNSCGRLCTETKASLPLGSPLLWAFLLTSFFWLFLSGCTLQGQTEASPPILDPQPHPLPAPWHAFLSLFLREMQRKWPRKYQIWKSSCHLGITENRSGRFGGVVGVGSKSIGIHFQNMIGMISVVGMNQGYSFRSL